MKDTVPTSIGLAENSVFGAHEEYPAAGAGVALAGRKIHPASKFCLHSWDMRRLHFTMGLSTDLDGGILFEMDSQDPPEEGEVEEPYGFFIGVVKATLAAATKGAVNSVEAAPPGAGDAVCQPGVGQAGGATAEEAPAKAAPARAAPAEAAPAGAAPVGAARAGAPPAGGPAVY